MSSYPQLPARPSARLPAGVLGLDYLKFLQLSVDDELACEGSFDDVALQDAMAAVRSGSMRAAQPAMKVFFDSCQYWLASHFHRYEAARRLGARHQEFWCEIQPGPKGHAVRYASGIPSLMRFHRDPSARAG
ncbi:hypothetical protein [Paraburkholderia tagetis]|uniref:Uncharacterized protein n=1 Tax=Paraburkholderia tagetis TaxID=2913261 RepID=A0A9X2A1Q9_9BURK|nr:hypothetical protein [Paraburkholderia tagetis]MCG5078815.1 hypothetical protein [Paraburkholderia tagetis]